MGNKKLFSDYSCGRQLIEGQKEYIKNSKAREESELYKSVLSYKGEADDNLDKRLYHAEDALV